jgi:hypothetical protein
MTLKSSLKSRPVISRIENDLKFDKRESETYRALFSATKWSNLELPQQPFLSELFSVFQNSSLELLVFARFGRNDNA